MWSSEDGKCSASHSDFSSGWSSGRAPEGATPIVIFYEWKEADLHDHRFPSLVPIFPRMARAWLFICAGLSMASDAHSDLPLGLQPRIPPSFHPAPRTPIPKYATTSGEETQVAYDSRLHLKFVKSLPLTVTDHSSLKTT